MADNDNIKALAEKLVAILLERGLTLATAESCTGGSIAAAITGVSGCSAVFNGSVVSYSNSVKNRVLGVSQKSLDDCGAVSEDVVRQMVAGVRRLMSVDCAVAVSGIAGPSGGTPDKPVGTVWVAVAAGDRVETRLLHLVDEGRECNIRKTVELAISLLLDLLSCDW